MLEIWSLGFISKELAAGRLSSESTTSGQRLFEVLLRAAAGRGGVLLGICFRLIRRLILIFDRFGSGLVGIRRRNVRGLRPAVRSLRHAVGSRLRSHFLHAVVDLLLEMIVHFL